LDIKLERVANWRVLKRSDWSAVKRRLLTTNWWLPSSAASESGGVCAERAFQSRRRSLNVDEKSTAAGQYCTVRCRANGLETPACEASVSAFVRLTMNDGCAAHVVTESLWRSDWPMVVHSLMRRPTDRTGAR